MAMHCSDCDMMKLAQSLVMENNIAACMSEIVAFIEFLTELVPDFETGIMSRNDLKALFDKYAGPNPPPGKFFRVRIFLFLSIFYCKPYHSLLSYAIRSK